MLTMNKIRWDISRLGRIYSKWSGLALTTISVRSVKNGTLFMRIKDKKTVRIETYNKFVQFCADNWPSYVEWPREIERPQRNAQKK